MVAAALRACPFPVFQRQRLVFPTTDRTQTAARIPAVGNNQSGAVAFCLVFDLRAEHPKAHVANGASELVVRHHALDIQVLDDHRLVFAAELSREFVGKIRSDIGNAGV